MSPAASLIKIDAPARCWFVGDIHGYGHELKNSLAAAGFAAEKGDIVVCVGDLISKGPDSLGTLELMEREGFYSVQGNHERRAIAALEHMEESGSMGDMRVQRWLAGNGSWFSDLVTALPDVPWQQLAALIKGKLCELPLALEVALADGRRVGVVHADCPVEHWSKIGGALRSIKGIDHALYNCRRIRTLQLASMPPPNTRIRGIDAVVHGHMVVEGGPLFVGNIAWIDTGRHLGGSLTMIEAQDLFLSLKAASASASAFRRSA